MTVEVNERGLPNQVTSEDERGRARSSAVETVGEVWRVDDEWWRKPIARQYVDLILEGGAHVVLYQDLITGEWFEQRL